MRLCPLPYIRYACVCHSAVQCFLSLFLSLSPSTAGKSRRVAIHSSRRSSPTRAQYKKCSLRDRGGKRTTMMMVIPSAEGGCAHTCKCCVGETHGDKKVEIPACVLLARPVLRLTRRAAPAAPTAGVADAAMDGHRTKANNA